MEILNKGEIAALTVARGLHSLTGMAQNFSFVAAGHAVAVAPDITIEIRRSNGPGSPQARFQYSEYNGRPVGRAGTWNWIDGLSCLWAD